MFWNSLKASLGYAVYFLIIYNITIIQQSSRNGKETTGIFFIMSFLLIGFVMLVFALIKTVLTLKFLVDKPFFDCIILYILSEVCISCFGGEVCFFGLFYKLKIYTVSYSSDLIPFRIARDMAISSSFLSAAVLYYLQRKITKNNIPSTETPK